MHYALHLSESKHLFPFKFVSTIEDAMKHSATMMNPNMSFVRKTGTMS